MKKLENKVAVITEEGTFVFITGRRQKELDHTIAAIGKP